MRYFDKYSRSPNPNVHFDQADNFIQERSEDDGGWRSARVVALLRVIEYHSGIVILTTNYVRKIDKAFRSRVNLALKYHDLNLESRKALWNKFLVLAGAKIENPDEIGSNYDISLEDINKLSESSGGSNGRVIKNVVQAAQALARSAQKPLAFHYVDQVWKIHEEFETDVQTESVEVPGG